MASGPAEKRHPSVYLLACLIAAAIVAIAELALRLQVIAALLPTPMRTSHPQLSQKLDTLDAELARGEPTDCLILGASNVDNGILAPILEAAYQLETRRPIRCFNFALIAADDREIALVADLLVRRYHPALLLFGTTSPVLLQRDGGRNVPAATDAERSLLGEPWLRYQQGEWSFEGWLRDHSLAYRSFRGIQWASHERPPIRPGRFRFHDGPVKRPARNSRPYGGGTCVERPELVRHHLDALDRSARLLAPRHAAIVEMPVRDPSCARFRESTLAGIEERLAPLGVPLFRLDGVDLPADVWQDDRHLTRRGAIVFSRWLGKRLGAAVLHGEIARSDW